jgi:hypothetical protein
MDGLGGLNSTREARAKTPCTYFGIAGPHSNPHFACAHAYPVIICSDALMRIPP